MGRKIREQVSAPRGKRVRIYSCPATFLPRSRFRGSRGSALRLLSLTMDGLLTAHARSDPVHQSSSLATFGRRWHNYLGELFEGSGQWQRVGIRLLPRSARWSSQANGRSQPHRNRMSYKSRFGLSRRGCGCKRRSRAAFAQRDMLSHCRSFQARTQGLVADSDATMI